jgi:hypothetical protein
LHECIGISEQFSCRKITGCLAALALAIGMCLTQFGTHGLSLDRKKRIAASDSGMVCA